ncbi:DNA mismatch repair protein MutS [Chloroflexota bacterium]
MKPFLMYKDQDFKPQSPSDTQELAQDLELDTLFKAMALDDDFLLDVAKKAVFSSLSDVDTIVYRQRVLKDCLKNPSIVRDIYTLATESFKNKEKQWLHIASFSPISILASSMAMLRMFVGLLKKLRTIADEYADEFESEGFTALFEMLKTELNDEYFAVIQNYFRDLEFQSGVLISAELGKDNEGTHYVLRKPQDKRQSWVKRVFANKPPVYKLKIRDSYELKGHDITLLWELRAKGINLVANTLAQSADHIDSFFKMLRIELAFYIACLNLYEQLAQIEEPITFPLPVAPDVRKHTGKGIYDVCLALTIKQKVVGNDLNAANKELVMVTGANQGGKSTFLRSIGLSQLMMQCGMFVPAESFCSNICKGIFTHFKREEDTTMNSGKLDEELSRMSNIVDNVIANSMVLFNESFSMTNQREGSEIARQITCALLEKNVKVFFVTHLYEFAHGFYENQTEKHFFLRAERKSDGRRTFKLIEEEPLQTSYGQDLYYKIFGKELKAS